jgi:hypothetical protein
MDRRDMTNVLLSGSLQPVPDTAVYSRAPKVSRLRCLRLRTDLPEDTDLFKHLWMMEEAQERVGVEGIRGTRRKRHLYGVPDLSDTE